MIATVWNTVLVTPILNLLMGAYALTADLGVSIILLTIVIRGALVPIILPSIRTMKKQRELQPELAKIKEKYANNKQKQAEMQMKLFKENGINPASGCSTQIVMLVILIALFNVIRKFALAGTPADINAHVYFDFLKLAGDKPLDLTFWYMDLSKPDPLYILAVLSGLFQLVATKMMMPAAKKIEKLAKATPKKTDDMATQMQQQMLYMMPVMNVVIGVTLPAGVVLYIVATSLFSIVQNYFVYGWGGLKPWINKLNFGKTSKTSS
jgi:YidC/Oxa1 family membrane protein insertase